MSVAVAMLVLLYVCLSVASKVMHRVSSTPMALHKCFFSFPMVVTERSLNNSSGGVTGPRRGHVGALTPLVRTLCRTLAVGTNWPSEKAFRDELRVRTTRLASYRYSLMEISNVGLI